MTAQALAVQTVMQATSGSTPEVQAAAIEILKPDQATSNELWRTLVRGLVIILVIALGGILFLLADGNDDTPVDVAVTVFSATLTGLLGLFAKSPVASA